MSNNNFVNETVNRGPSQLPVSQLGETPIGTRQKEDFGSGNGVSRFQKKEKEPTLAHWGDGVDKTPGGENNFKYDRLTVDGDHREQDREKSLAGVGQRVGLTCVKKRDGGEGSGLERGGGTKE